MEKDANIALSVDEFKKELQTQFGMIPEFSSILVGLDEKLAYARQEAQQQEKEILAYNTEKFDTLRMYIQKQYDETAHMSNIIDLLQSEGTHTLADIPIERALLLSDTMIRQSQKLAQEWNDKNTTTLDDIDTSNDG